MTDKEEKKMTDNGKNLIDFEEALERKLYEESREQLRLYYGDRVDTMDYGDLDEYGGRLDWFIEDHDREPLNPLEFLKWAEEGFRKEHELALKIFHSWDDEVFLQTLAKEGIWPI